MLAPSYVGTLHMNESMNPFRVSTKIGHVAAQGQISARVSQGNISVQHRAISQPGYEGAAARMWGIDSGPNVGH